MTVDIRTVGAVIALLLVAGYAVCLLGVLAFGSALAEKVFAAVVVAGWLALYIGLPVAIVALSLRWLL